MKKVTLLFVIIISLALMDFSQGNSVNSGNQVLTKPRINGPDLFIKKISVSPKSATILDSPKVYFVIGNQGAQRCEASRAQLQIKKNDGTVIQERTVKVFALNPTKTFSARLVMNKITTPGSYSFEVTANYDKGVVESNYNNNLGGTGKTIKGMPDLIVCYRYYNVRTTVRKKLYALVKNIGSRSSEACKLSFGISSKGIRLFKIPALDPGEVFRVYRIVRWYTKGVRRVVLKVDPDNKVVELNEKNNKAETKVRVTLLADKYKFLGYKCSDGSNIGN